MPISTVIKCDICGAERLQTNHWFVAESMKGFKQIQISPFLFSMLDVYQIASKNITILCGEACVHTYISQSLASLHTPSQSDRPIAEKERQDEQVEESKEPTESNRCPICGRYMNGENPTCMECYYLHQARV